MPARARSGAAMSAGQALLGFGLVAVGVVGTLATVLGFFGSAWWLFDFAANFRAHLAVALVVTGIAYALLYSKATGLFFLMVAGVNALLVMPLYTDGPADPRNEETAMRIVSFNVGQRASIRDTTYRWINTVEADLVVLLDTTEAWVGDGAGAEPLQVQTEMPLDRPYGITVLSETPVETELLRVSSARDYVVRIEASMGDQPVVVYAVQTRGATDDTKAGLRDEYLEEVGRMVQAETVPTVVVGDFGASPWSHAFRSLESEAALINSMKGKGIQTTWPADRWAIFRLPVDHLMHTQELTTVERYLGPMFGVEHRPIVVTVAAAA